MNQIFNPFLPLYEYIPDGEPHVFGDRVYLFGSHDKEGGDTFCMLDYTVYSANINNLKNWRCEGVIYQAKQDPLYSPERPYMYAPDVVQGNDGRFYLYYCLSGKFGIGGYHGPISVAVCDTPAGKYQYLGIVRNPDGSPMKTYVCFDPAVMNDNGTIRLYYGTQYPYEEEPGFRDNPERIQQECDMFGKTAEEILNTPESVMGASMCILDNDMLTVTEPPKHIIPYAVKGTSFEEHPFFEASSMRKVGMKYYFIYSSQQNHELCYAVSDFPDKDFTFGGTIVSNGDIGYHGRKSEDRLNMTGTTHGSMIQIQNQWYVFYHRLTHKSDYSRQACAERIVILPDGSIPQVEITSCGLNGAPLNASGSYPAVIACNITNGHMPHGSNSQYQEKFPHVTHQMQDRFIAEIENNTLIGYKYFHFASGQKNLKLKIRYQSTGYGLFRIYTDEERRQPAGEIGISPSGIWTEAEAQISVPHGIRPLYLQYFGEGEVSLLDFAFVSDTYNPDIQPGEKNSFFMALALVAGAGIFLAGASFAGRIINQPEKNPPAVLEETSEALSETIYFPPSATETESYRTSRTTTSTKAYGSEGYPEGEYEIGKDIPAGKYVALPNDRNPDSHFYFGIYAEPYEEGKANTKIGGGWKDTNYYIELKDGEFIHFTWADLYPIDDNISHQFDSASQVKGYSSGRRPYEAGDYEIGTDIPAGLYLAVADTPDDSYGDFYFGIYDRPYSESESTPAIGGGWQQNYYYIELEEGEYIHFSWAKLYPFSESSQKLDPYSSTGMFMVWSDIPGGTYTLKADSDYDGEFSVLNSAGVPEKYAENAVISDDIYGDDAGTFFIPMGETAEVTLGEEQYLKTKFCHVVEESYPEGTYTVGEKIPAGLYASVYQPKTTWGDEYLIEVRDSQDNSVLIGGYTHKCRYVELKEGQTVTFQNSTLYNAEYTRHMPDAFGNDGMYWVGHDVPAGTYDIIGGYGDS